MGPVTLAWIAAYTICLVNVGLLLYRYVSYRLRSLLYLFLLVVDMLFVTVVVMVLVVTVGDARLFDAILTNCLLTYYVTVPLFVFETTGVKPPKRLIGSVLAGSVVVYNVLVWVAPSGALYALYWVPIVLMTLPVSVRSWRKGDPSLYPRPSFDERERALRRNINLTGVIAGATAFVLGFAFFLFVQTPLGTSPLFVNGYFAAFTLLYQLPVTYFCLRGFPAPLIEAGGTTPPTSPDPVALGLTAREQEVALRLYEGLKYEEIAEQLFVSLSAVKKHVYNIYRKTGVRNNRQLIRKLIGRDPGEHHPRAD